MERRQIPTEADKVALTPQQELAADLLATGQSVTDTAQAVSASRQTVSQWLNTSVPFRAEVGRRRAELWDVATSRLRALTLRALDVVEQELQANNLRAAETVLRATGLQGLGAPGGPTSPTDVRLADAERNAERRLREMGLEVI